MEGYTSEREQVDAIRQWWQTNGKSIAIGLAVGLAGLGGYRYWDGMQNAQAENASINYEQFLNLAAQGGGKEALETGEAILKAYPDSSYARLTGLLLAKLEVDDGKIEAAKTHLQWVIDHAGSDEVAAIAKARMAQLVLAEGDAEAALKLFDQIDAAHSERFAELKGDILARLGRRDDAVKAYAQAQKFVTEAGADTRLIELKIEALGLDPAAQ
ncbi:MAG: YfgM family protein [Gammaproteobacteria bacterium]